NSAFLRTAPRSGHYSLRPGTFFLHSPSLFSVPWAWNPSACSCRRPHHARPSSPRRPPPCICRRPPTVTLIRSCPPKDALVRLVSVAWRPGAAPDPLPTSRVGARASTSCGGEADGCAGGSRRRQDGQKHQRHTCGAPARFERCRIISCSNHLLCSWDLICLCTQPPNILDWITDPPPWLVMAAAATPDWAAEVPVLWAQGSWRP
ncbi:unnamed protein product, partial [Urochloa humidicola]